MRLEPFCKYYTALKNLTTNELASEASNILQPPPGDSEYDPEVPYLQVYTAEDLGSNVPFTIIGPSTIPVRFKAEYRDHPSKSEWFFKGSVYSYKSKRWRIVWEIKANYDCDEDEAFKHPLAKTMGRLLYIRVIVILDIISYGVKSADPFEFPLSANLAVLLRAFSGADEDQTHYNTESTVEGTDQEDEIYL
jgi:hypothetical protein